MRRISALAMLAVVMPSAGTALAGELEGPGRFCGYSLIIDLIPGERIETLQGGIHGGSFRWRGHFGVLDVYGIGWAKVSGERRAAKHTGKGYLLFDQGRAEDGHTVAISNGRHAAAYFSSPRRLTRAQLAAIDRVGLFEEGEEPRGCKLRTMFSWE